MKILSFDSAPLFFTRQDLADLQSTALDSLRSMCHAHWERTLRAFFDEHECGMPTVETLRNHGLWMIPHASQTRGLLHKLFAWRGQIVFEGWADAVTGQHVIHPHAATTPKPWEQTSGQECPRSLPPHET